MVMDMEYYQTLGVSRDADEKAIKAAYRKKAMKWHPDRHEQGDKAAAEAKFKEISEAYEVLSDPEKKKIYDSYGKAGLDGQMPGQPGGGGGNFQRANPEDIFAAFFGNGGGATFGGGRSGGPNVFHFEGGNGAGSSPFGNLFGESSRERRKGATVQSELKLTLEELFEGCTKNMKITRQIIDGHSGQRVPVEKVLTINVMPGWKEGVKITFDGEGNETRGAAAGDIQFIVKQRPHSRFKREGDDLVVDVPVTLKQALCGDQQVAVSGIDGKRLVVPLPAGKPVAPGQLVRLSGQGMPRRGKGKSGRGDLIVRMNVSFPSTLTQEQREVLRDVL